MIRELLSQWLDLPATPWPPDHYALLGLQRGKGGMDEVEQRVLERMERLRHHQLMHPEPVTEGMNLLAQAMIALTDPESRRNYDRSLGLRAEQVLVLEPIELDEDVPEPPKVESRPIFAKSERRTPFAEPLPAASLAPPPNAQTKIYSPDDRGPIGGRPVGNGEPSAEEIVIPELEEMELVPLPGEEEPEEEGPEEEQRERYSDVDDEEEREPRETPRDRKAVHEALDFSSDEALAERRQIYAEIVRVRRVLRVWERLKAFLDDPDKAFLRRTDTVAFMTCLADLRPLLPTVSDLVGGPDLPGSLVATLAKQQLVVSMFRSLLPSQRGALAQDCRLAHDELLGRYQRLRDEVRQLTAKSFARRVWNPMGRAIVSRPEWILLIVSVLALWIAFIRSWPKGT
jgi:hypothetical protein